MFSFFNNHQIYATELYWAFIFTMLISIAANFPYPVLINISWLKTRLTYAKLCITKIDINSGAVLVHLIIRNALGVHIFLAIHNNGFKNIMTMGTNIDPVVITGSPIYASSASIAQIYDIINLFNWQQVAYSYEVYSTITFLRFLVGEILFWEDFKISFALAQHSQERNANQDRCLKPICLHRCGWETDF